MDEPQRISFDPDPPKQGKPLKICYDFTGLANNQATLAVSFDDGTSENHEATPTSPCFTIQVPSDAETILVEDLYGPSPDKGGIIDP